MKYLNMFADVSEYSLIISKITKAISMILIDNEGM